MIGEMTYFGGTNMKKEEMINKIEKMNDNELYKFIEYLLSESPEFGEYLKEELGDD